MADTYRADTILAIDIGTATTRAALFDVVEGVHRLVISAEAASTVEAPYFDASEGVHHAVRELESLTGRPMLDQNAQLIVPVSGDGSGADVVVATLSAGPALRTLLVGLLPEISLENARQLAASAYCSVVEAFSLGDFRNTEQQLDAAVSALPDLIIIAGGTDSGAQEALLRQLDTVNIACNLLPAGHRPHVLYAGNAALQATVTKLFGEAATVHSAPNVQPALGPEARVLTPARTELANVLNQMRQAQIGGLANLSQTMGGFPLLPTALAEGQTLHFISQTLKKNVLSVNVGAAATSLAAALPGAATPWINVRPDLGLGVNAPQALAETSTAKLLRWLPFELPGEDAAICDFLYNKSTHPYTLPADTNDLYLELALLRELIRANLRQARASWPSTVYSAEGQLQFDTLIGGGAALGRAPHPGLAALALLDALEPGGFVASLLVDEHHLLAALGALAPINPLAVVQILEGELFSRLGVAVCASGLARPGERICQVKLAPADGPEITADMRVGSLAVLPLALGQRGKLTLRPRVGIDVGFGPGRGATRDVFGGTVGVILDSRGRPLLLSDETARQREAVQQWIEQISASAT